MVAIRPVGSGDLMGGKRGLVVSGAQNLSPEQEGSEEGECTLRGWRGASVEGSQGWVGGGARELNPPNL